MQPTQLTLDAAVTEAPENSEQLVALASAHRLAHPQANHVDITRCWVPSAGTYCYQTHIAIAQQPDGRLDWLAEVFYNAASLPSHPWYPHFIEGKVQALGTPCAEGIAEHQLALGVFDLGLSTPRCYRQLVSLAMPSDATRVIVARSVDEGPAPPKDAKLVFTTSPNVEVLHFERGLLHWHHICCTPGAGILPGPLDRWLINALRKLGLDQAECNTYRNEAQQLRDWLAGMGAEGTIASQ
ncbi:MAG: hypothetical protein V2J89_14200 [Halieaceae bacterium]|jgi:hypothetical protein|nr:hypothetical protein [Halieaceae bacterium]